MGNPLTFGDPFGTRPKNLHGALGTAFKNALSKFIASPLRLPILFMSLLGPPDKCPECKKMSELLAKVDSAITQSYANGDQESVGKWLELGWGVAIAGVVGAGVGGVLDGALDAVPSPVSLPTDSVLFSQSSVNGVAEVTASMEANGSSPVSGR